jgi:hypothetical protein
VGVLTPRPWEARILQQKLFFDSDGFKIVLESLFDARRRVKKLFPRNIVKLGLEEAARIQQAHSYPRHAFVMPIQFPNREPSTGQANEDALLAQDVDSEDDAGDGGAEEDEEEEEGEEEEEEDDLGDDEARPSYPQPPASTNQPLIGGGRGGPKPGGPERPVPKENP